MLLSSTETSCLSSGIMDTLSKTGLSSSGTEKKYRVSIPRKSEIFTDEGDIVIDPCAGSGSTLRAAKEMNRDAYGFEISAEFYYKAVNQMLA